MKYLKILNSFDFCLIFQYRTLNYLVYDWRNKQTCPAETLRCRRGSEPQFQKNHPKCETKSTYWHFWNARREIFQSNADTEILSLIINNDLIIKNKRLLHWSKMFPLPVETTSELSWWGKWTTVSLWLECAPYDNAVNFHWGCLINYPLIYWTVVLWLLLGSQWERMLPFLQGRDGWDRAAAQIPGSSLGQETGKEPQGSVLCRNDRWRIWSLWKIQFFRV